MNPLNTHVRVDGTVLPHSGIIAWTLAVVGMLACVGCSQAEVIPYRPVGQIQLASRTSQSVLQLLIGDVDRSLIREYAVLVAREVVDDGHSDYLLLAPKMRAEQRTRLTGLRLSDAVPVHHEEACKLIGVLGTIARDWEAKRPENEGLFGETLVGREKEVGADDKTAAVEVWLRVAWNQTAEGTAVTVSGRRGPADFVFEYNRLEQIVDLCDLLTLGLRELERIDPALKCK